MTEILAGLTRHDDPVSFTEQVFHPALPAPRTSRGEMETAPNGDLIRRQAWPEPEDSRVGTRFVTITKNGEPNLLPIPDHLQVWLSSLRALIAGGAFPEAARPELLTTQNTWQIRISVPDQPEQSITVLGCGQELWQLELTQPDQIRRVISFETR